MKFKRNTVKECSDYETKKSVPTDGDSNGKKQRRVISYIVLVTLGLIMLGLVGGIIASAVIFAYKPTSDGNTNVFISIASLLITLLTLVVPLTSYTLNKKEVERISDDIDKKIKSGKKKTDNAIKANYEEMSNAIEKLDEIDKIKTDFDNRYTDLAESIVNGFSVDENDRDNSETKVNIGYINALLCYDRGNYGDCKNKIRDVWVMLLNLFECEDSKEKIGADIEFDNKFALLTYKVINLYRHVAGRTRDFEGVIWAVREAISCVKNLPYGKNSKAYVVLNYIMARMEIDTIEKSGNISKVQNDIKIVKFINDSYAYCEMINSVEKCDERQRKFLICSIMARVYQIATRYSTNEKTKDGTHKKDIYSGLSNLYVSEACHILLHDDWKSKLNISEIDKVLYNGCRFSVAKTLGKLSYNTIKDIGPDMQLKLMGKDELLEKAVEQLHIEGKYFAQFNIGVEMLSYKDDLFKKAKNLLENLIKEKRDPKYYLELSEIHKACKEWRDSEKAARYGYSLAPCDPLLAAQCAHIGLHNYLASGKRNDFYLNRTFEYIDNAYFTYIREKEWQDNDQERVNIKFLYIPSLFAVIKALSYDLDKKESEDEKNIKSYFNEIEGYVRESFAGVPTFANSVPNYMRALVAYYEFYNKITNSNVREECIKGMVHICAKYWSNKTLWFSLDTDFYSDTYKISEMCLTCYKIYKPAAALQLSKNDDGIITHVTNENGSKFTFHEFIQKFTEDLSRESNKESFFTRMFDLAYEDEKNKFIEQIGKLIDGAYIEGEVCVDGGQRLYLKVI
ncbi:MAG: hypothetical protein J1G01_02820 [Clostridiales bacterium]|nr:hypothetical protein [Clostridiales bacterium]